MGEEKKETEPKMSKENSDAQNKTLKNIFIGLGVIVFLIIIVAFSINSAKHFEYRGITFDVVKEIAPYQTKVPLIYQGQPAEYNFYFRNDPRKLKNIPFEGEIILREDLVINETQNFMCGGDGLIGIQNMKNLYGLFGTKFIKDPEAGCDIQGRYTFIQIREGDETSIEQFGPSGTSCYNFYVNDCEMFEITERFMIELLVKAKNNE